MNINENQYKIIVDSSPNMIWRSGKDGLCNFFNKTWLAFTGRSLDQEMGNGWADGVHPDDYEYCISVYTASFCKQEKFEMNYRLKRKDMQWRWINDRGVPFFDENHLFQGYIGSCMDITEQIIGGQLRSMAQVDGLTGINNRQYFMQLAEEEIEKAARFHQSLCISMIDINGFKTINDTYGHQAGDTVLKDFAQIMSREVRKFDIIGRYGGDEFIILFPNSDMEQAAQVMKRIETIMQTPFDLPEEISMKVLFSYGLAQMKHDDSLESLIRRADQTMYQMKKNKNIYSEKYSN